MLREHLLFKLSVDPKEFSDSFWRAYHHLSAVASGAPMPENRELQSRLEAFFPPQTIEESKRFVETWRRMPPEGKAASEKADRWSLENVIHMMAEPMKQWEVEEVRELDETHLEIVVAMPEEMTLRGVIGELAAFAGGVENEYEIPSPVQDTPWWKFW